MTNGDYNPFFRHERLSNDAKQKRIVMFASAFAAIVIVAMIIAAVFSTHACGV